MDEFDSLKMDKTTLTFAALSDPSGDKEYWLSKSPYERLKAVETLRKLNDGSSQSTSRLQRVLELNDLENLS